MSKSGFKLHDGQDLYDVMDVRDSNAGSLGFKTSTDIDIGNATSAEPLSKELGFKNQDIDLGNLRGGTPETDPYFDEDGKYFQYVPVEITEDENKFTIKCKESFKSLWKLGSLNRYREASLDIQVSKANPLNPNISIELTGGWTREDSFITDPELYNYYSYNGIYIRDKENLLFCSDSFDSTQEQLIYFNGLYDSSLLEWCEANKNKLDPALFIAGFNKLKGSIRNKTESNIKTVKNVPVETPTGTKYADIVYIQAFDILNELNSNSFTNNPGEDFASNYRNSSASINSVIPNYITDACLAQVYYHDLDDSSSIDYSKPDAFIGYFKYNPEASIDSYIAFYTAPKPEVSGDYSYCPYDVLQQSFFISKIHNNFFSPGLVKVKTPYKEAKISTVARMDTEEDFDGDLLGFCVSPVYLNSLKGLQNEPHSPNPLFLTIPLLTDVVLENEDNIADYYGVDNKAVICFMTKGWHKDNKNKDFNYLGLKDSWDKKSYNKFYFDLSLWANNEECYLSTNASDVNVVITHPTYDDDELFGSINPNIYLFATSDTSGTRNNILVEESLTQNNPYPANNGLINITTTPRAHNIITNRQVEGSTPCVNQLTGSTSFSKDNAYILTDINITSTGTGGSSKFVVPANNLSTNSAFMSEPERTVLINTTCTLAPVNTSNTISYNILTSDIAPKAAIEIADISYPWYYPPGMVPKNVFNNHPELQNDDYISKITISFDDDESARQYLNTFIDKDFDNALETYQSDKLVWLGSIVKAYSTNSSIRLTNTGTYSGDIAFGERHSKITKAFSSVVDMKLNLIKPQNANKVLLDNSLNVYGNLAYPRLPISISMLRNLRVNNSFVKDALITTNYRSMQAVDIKTFIDPEVAEATGNYCIDSQTDKYWYCLGSYFDALYTPEYPTYNYGEKPEITEDGAPYNKYYEDGQARKDTQSLCSQFFVNPYYEGSLYFTKGSCPGIGYLSTELDINGRTVFDDAFSLIKYKFTKAKGDDKYPVKVITDKLKLNFPEDNYTASREEANVKAVYYNLHTGGSPLFKGTVSNIEAGSKLQSCFDISTQYPEWEKTYESAKTSEAFRENVFVDGSFIIRYVPPLDSDTVYGSGYLKLKHESPEYNSNLVYDLEFKGSMISTPIITSLRNLSYITEAQKEAYKQGILLGDIASVRFEYSIPEWNYIFNNAFSRQSTATSNVHNIRTSLKDAEALSTMVTDNLNGGDITMCYQLEKISEKTRKFRYYKLNCEAVTSDDPDTVIDTFTVWIRKENTCVNPVVKNLFTSNINSETGAIEPAYADVLESLKPDLKFTSIDSIDYAHGRLSCNIEDVNNISGSGISFSYLVRPNFSIDNEDGYVDNYVIEQNTVPVKIIFNTTSVIVETPEDIVYSNVVIKLQNAAGAALANNASATVVLQRKHNSSNPYVYNLASLISSVIPQNAVYTPTSVTSSNSSVVDVLFNTDKTGLNIWHRTIDKSLKNSLITLTVKGNYEVLSPDDVVYSNVKVVLTNTNNNAVTGSTTEVSKTYNILRKHTLNNMNLATISDIMSSYPDIMYWYGRGNNSTLSISGANLIAASTNFDTTIASYPKFASVNFGYASMPSKIPVTAPATITVTDCFAAFKANDRMYTINIQCIDSNDSSSSVFYSVPLLAKHNSVENALVISKFDIEVFLSDKFSGIDGIEYYDSTVTQNSHTGTISYIYSNNPSDNTFMRIWFTAPRTSASSTVGVTFTWRFTPIT